jgi:hypothetical protein
MSGALAEIQQDINAGVTGSGATWVGAAADTARGQLGPLGEWAQQAASAADVMRISTELQADLLGKARAAMPVPIPAPVPPSPMARLFGAQVDYETAELVKQIAQEQAYQVMAQYEAATSDNTSTLGDFGEPPQLVVDASPITGVAVRAPVGEPEVVGSASPVRSAGGPAVSPSESPAPRRGSRTSRSGLRERVSVEPEPARQYAAEEVPAPDPLPSVTDPSSPSVTSPSVTSPAAAASGSGPGVAARPGQVAGGTRSIPRSIPLSGTSTPSGAGVAGSGSTEVSSAGSVAPARDRRTSDDAAPGATGPQANRFTGGAMVPAARRPAGEDEPEDAVHESKYLIEADDIYGRQSYSPPVIGESPRRR